MPRNLIRKYTFLGRTIEFQYLKTNEAKEVQGLIDLATTNAEKIKKLTQDNSKLARDVAQRKIKAKSKVWFSKSLKGLAYSPLLAAPFVLGWGVWYLIDASLFYERLITIVLILGVEYGIYVLWSRFYKGLKTMVIK